MQKNYNPNFTVIKNFFSLAQQNGRSVEDALANAPGRMQACDMKG